MFKVFAGFLGARTLSLGPPPVRPESDEPLIISGERKIIARREPFGPNYFWLNVTRMTQFPKYGRRTLRAATTAESILIADQDFPGRARRQILDVTELQLGLGLMGRTAVFINPPKNAKGEYITDEAELNALLRRQGVESVGGVQLVPNNTLEGALDFGAINYNAFPHGSNLSAIQFVSCGLASLLEHTTAERAEHLRSIARTDNYPGGIYVHGFHPYNFKAGEPPLCTLTLFSGDLDKEVLGLVAAPWCDSKDGYAYGVYDAA